MKEEPGACHLLDELQEVIREQSFVAPGSETLVELTHGSLRDLVQAHVLECLDKRHHVDLAGALGVYPLKQQLDSLLKQRIGHVADDLADNLTLFGRSHLFESDNHGIKQCRVHLVLRHAGHPVLVQDEQQEAWDAKWVYSRKRRSVEKQVLGHFLRMNRTLFVEIGNHELESFITVERFENANGKRRIAHEKPQGQSPPGHVLHLTVLFVLSPALPLNPRERADECSRKHNKSNHHKPTHRVDGQPPGKIHARHKAANPEHAHDIQKNYRI
mmetsp:Transcript_23506/g.59444  ORF Transcript_23506/g.59444 Transcript_23506/m.59444 type:complete len:272 (+) Transcript_23506:2500-3315(+)